MNKVWVWYTLLSLILPFAHSLDCSNLEHGFYCDLEDNSRTFQYLECGEGFQGWRDCPGGTKCMSEGRSTNLPCTTETGSWTSGSDTSGGSSSSGGDQAPYSCDPEVCQLPTCKCASTSIPGSLEPSRTPQFVTLTFDDALTNLVWTPIRQVLLESNAIDDANCHPKAVFFLTNENTNYHNIHVAKGDGCEIAKHTITHTTGINSNSSTWFAEMVYARQYTSYLTDTPEDEIVGWRYPFLQHNHDGFQTLLENGYLYDSTLPDKWGPNGSGKGNRFWPYTLDYGSPNSCDTGICPVGNYPGLWEIPMAGCYNNDVPYDLMDPPGTYEFILNLFKTNFDDHYNGNRSPFGIYLHGAWLLMDTTRVQVLQEFFRYVASKEGTFFVTNKQIIDWVKDPVDIDATKTRFQCAPHPVGVEVCDGIDNDRDGIVDNNLPNRCAYGEPSPFYTYWTCAPNCYSEVPSVNGDFSIRSGSSTSTSTTTTTTTNSAVTTSGSQLSSSTTSSSSTTAAPPPADPDVVVQFVVSGEETEFNSAIFVSTIANALSVPVNRFSVIQVTKRDLSVQVRILGGNPTASSLTANLKEMIENDHPSLSSLGILSMSAPSSETDDPNDQDEGTRSIEAKELSTEMWVVIGIMAAIGFGIIITMALITTVRLVQRHRKETERRDVEKQNNPEKEMTSAKRWVRDPSLAEVHTAPHTTKVRFSLT